MRHSILFLLIVGITCVLPAWADRGNPEDCILFEASYGERLPGSTDDVAVWWASSGWKVSKTRPAPAKRGKALYISAAGNEAEAAQLVVSPSHGLKDLSAKPTILRGPDAAIIPASSVDVLRVRYVFVEQPTDKFGAKADWPDPLPPFKEPIDVAAGENQPLWVRVDVPCGAPKGIYEGAVQLRADNFSADVPIQVRVYGFELPDRMTCTTAFGFNPSTVFAYQGVSDPEQRRQVIDKYLANYSAHHISPYDPTIFSSLPVEWVKIGENDEPGLDPADRKLLQENALTPKFDWTAWDEEMEKAFSHYHFNSFRLGLPGMGGGEVAGFAGGTRERALAFERYCKTMQEHLREKGWLDEAYVYWFDEPNQGQYEYVLNGFLELKKAAPDINRMLTEHVREALIGGPNIWCPDSWWYVHEDAEKRRKEGDIFWWYVCTVPKAPFPGLFTDHPATDLRVWLWQTWKYDIEGVLVWATNLWTTSAAYPNSQQNPYEDTMSWISGYGVKRGEKKPWGNGDGRFVYPPEDCAVPTKGHTCLDGPVESIRWEMLRDGIEDYEYLAILERLVEERRTQCPRKCRKAAKLLEVPDEITSSLKAYTKVPEPIEERRDRIARAIEALLE